MTPRRTALAAAALMTPALLAAMLVAPTAATAAGPPSLELVGRYQVTGGAEVSAYMDGVLYVINGEGIDIVPTDPMTTALARTGSVDLSGYGAEVTSVAAKDGLVAAAVPNDDKTLPGVVVIMDGTGKVLTTVTVGALPDMLTFDDKGQMLVVANEGEPAGYPSTPTSDPEGSVTVIYVDRLLRGQGLSVRTIGFADFNVGAPRNAELPKDVRIFGPGASVAQDLEPEYVTIVGNRGYVTLQENNAVAEVDLRSGRVVAIRALGLKDHSLPGAGLDPSDRDSAVNAGINIAPWRVKGLYQPDAIASFQANGTTYLVTANEGDARDYDGYAEEVRVGSGSYVLDPIDFPDAAQLKANVSLGRLNASRASGDIDGDGMFDEIHVFGARSVSIWSTDGTRLWDSGDQLEQVTAAQLPDHFNVSNENETDGTLPKDNRSDNKGPEPEGVAVGRIDGRTYAFVGLERIGGMAVFDVTTPTSPAFVEYVNSRDFALPSDDAANDSGPEVLSFVPASESSTGRPLVIMSNEISGSVTIWSPRQ